MNTIARGVDMKYRVDWLSFTVPLVTKNKVAAYELVNYIASSCWEFLGELASPLFDIGQIKQGRGRAPYALSWSRSDNGVFVFGDWRKDHILLEITGRGCEAFREQDDIIRLVEKVAGRCTRIDLAVDMETDIKPYEFAHMRDVERFKNVDDRRSETGDTYYVGSMKSERYARVYRFAEPHPRSHLLRMEAVFRKKAAKAFCKSLVRDGYEACINSIGAVYGWSHPVWRPYDTGPADLESGQTRKGDKNTVNWLYGSVASSIVKQAKLGELDINHYLTYVKSLLTAAEIDVKLD